MLTGDGDGDAVIVYTASDHAGFSLRRTLVERLRGQGHEVVDLGTDSEATCDYPEFASAVANSVRATPGSLGILVCATGQGMAIAAGKVRGIRAVVPFTVEAARLSRFDNNANVLCLAGRLMSEGDAYAIVDTWLATGFAGGRHARRIAKVAAIETASAVAFITESERLGLANRGVPGRLFARDPSLFDADVSRHPSILASLGWLLLPSHIGQRTADLAVLAACVRQERITDIILLVDRAESSPALLPWRLWAAEARGLRLHVVGARDAQSGLGPVLELPSLPSALVLLLVGGTAEDVIMEKERALWERMLACHGGDAQRAGRHFAAVVPTPSALEDIARAHHYGAVLTSPAGIADSFLVAGYGSMVVALLGLDTARLLSLTEAMVEACRVERLEANPGVSLGMLIGALAKHGRKTLTLLLSKSLSPLGAWIADVMAKATAAAPRRIQTVWNEPLRHSYAPDRVFVHVQAADDPPAIPPDAMEALHTAGQPYIQIALQDKHELGAEMFRWQIAATVAALVLEPAP